MALDGWMLYVFVQRCRRLRPQNAPPNASDAYVSPIAVAVGFSAYGCSQDRNRAGQGRHLDFLQRYLPWAAAKTKILITYKIVK
jgi:hypothetical protein